MNIINLISSVFVALSIIWCSEQRIKFTGENLNITIYNQEMAFIEESRSATFSTIGEQKFRFIGFPDQLNQSSIQIVSNNCFINEFNIFNQAITNQALLNSFIGKNVSLVKYDENGTEKRFPAIVLSNNNEPVFMVNDEIWIDPNFDVIYPYLPDNLAYNNSILCSAEIVNLENKFFLNYLAGGFDWDVDYFLNINNEDSATLSAWHSIKNESLINYKNVTLSLVSGDVSFINSTQFNKNKREMMGVAKQSSIPNTSFTNDYAVFHIPGDLSLPQKSLSKYQFISGEKIKIIRSYHIEHTYRKYIKNNSIPIPVTSTLTIDSNEIVDFNLPGGTFHVYENLKDQNIFVGENIVPLTQVGDEVVLTLGRTADITARFTYLSIKSDRRVTTYKLRVFLKNIRNGAASVAWKEKISGDWKIIDSTDEYLKIDSQTAQFIVDIPSKGEKEITFSVIINN